MVEKNKSLSLYKGLKLEDSCCIKIKGKKKKVI